MHEYYSYSYSLILKNTNIIRIRIWSKFWFRILFVFVFGPKNSTRSPLICNIDVALAQSGFFIYKKRRIKHMSHCCFWSATGPSSQGLYKISDLRQPIKKPSTWHELRNPRDCLTSFIITLNKTIKDSCSFLLLCKIFNFENHIFSMKFSHFDKKIIFSSD